ncbi:hypothetical protein FPRO06_10325 [Fusarium proliferatum]|uniref:Zn(2)-C6 fungal-type domain-containing protein n=2 Tax=Gibberella intermedia TaxID=948311 RepID=A0A365MZ14_GIBIN|nr:uncharacterized protein FPRO_11773 [Fusarium proliferatum ET1]KAG4253414.1 hypothetical protein FPRO03_07374 [Fusarium proliferatum]KAI1049309.1 hypothetical protein LB506_004883 [Fusarium annulatum]KAG4267067.1 hypothetical protein FPRO04_04679 [Fusarium proliferatum]KAG4281420.1 hypothetical protein FPRO06_10325 [Fusarium proliferatum]RBA13780.1 hypothetical protein FPRO05_02573 [Fusarium proliferatum]
MLSSSYAPAPKTITRSRTGCAVCKSKRLKCDESKPACSRCVRLGIPCPGYQKPLRWKAGSKSPKDVVETPRSDVNADPQPSSAYVPYQTQPAEQFVNNFYDPELMDQLNDAMNPGCVDTQGQETLDTALPLMQFPDDVLQLYPEQALGQTPDTIGQGSTDERLWPVATITPTQQYPPAQATSQALTRHEPQNQTVESVGEMPLAHALQDYSSVLVEYYFKEVCGMMSCYDSSMNPYRTTISNMWSGSQSLYYITQSMAAACLSEVSPNFTPVGRQLRDQAMICLSREAKISQLETSSLLALVMLGMSLSWHDPGSLGQMQFEVLSRMVQSAEARGDALAIADKKKEFFFYNSLVYWKMLLSFVTDVDSSTRHVQPQPVPPECLDLQEPRMPHPQTGIGIEVQELVAKVGSLVRKERKRIRSRRFVSQEDIQRAQEAMIASEQLHSELCAIRLPTENDIVDAGDDMTPANHLVSIAEAYRCTGLLQLYRNFPDLLGPYIQSGSPNNQAFQSGSPDAASSYPDDRTLADTWLTCLALHVLDLVKDIPTTSRSRSIQPLLFVSICSEMSLNRSYCGISNLQQPPVASIATSTRFRVPLAGLDVLQARKTIISRLSAFENILAAKPIRQMLTLVKKTWSCMDEEKQDVYWMDVMMENGYETLMG